MANRVVAHFHDGHLVKGISMDVAPNRSLCHVRTDDGSTVTVALADLKALFFVHEFGGNPAYVESETAAVDDMRLHGTHQITVQFKDGERMVALTNRVPPRKPFFFMMPIDNRSNNIRILANANAITEIAA